MPSIQALGIATARQIGAISVDAFLHETFLIPDKRLIKLLVQMGVLKHS